MKNNINQKDKDNIMNIINDSKLSWNAKYDKIIKYEKEKLGFTDYHITFNPNDLSNLKTQEDIRDYAEKCAQELCMVHKSIIMGDDSLIEVTNLDEL